MDLRYLEFKRRALRTCAWVSLMLLFVNVYSTAGFVFIEGVTWFDAFYMAAITITTVGYGETIPLSATGRMFAVSCIYLGLLTSGFSLALLTNLFFEGTLVEFFKARARERTMRSFKDHFIVCGYGTTGKEIVRELLEQGDQVVVIDQVEQDSSPNCVFIVGDARKDDVLRQAGIEKAHGLASTLTDDADNVFVVLSARALNQQIKIVSRFKADDTERKLEVAGVNHAISPYRMGGHRLAMALTNPPFLEVLDASFQKTSLKVKFHHLRIPPQSRLADMTLKEAHFREHTMGALIVAIIDKQGSTMFNPNGDYPLGHASQILVLADDEQLVELKAMLTENV